MPFKKIWTSILSRFKPSAPYAEKNSYPAYPLDLRIGASVSLTKDCILQIQDLVSHDIPRSSLSVDAIGEIDLGQGEKLYRFYLSDDRFFIQFHLTDSDMTSTESISLFHYDSWELFNDLDAAWELMNEGVSNLMTSKRITHLGQEFTRSWGEESRDNVGLATFEEVVITNESSFIISYNAMLFSRQLKATSRSALLMKAIEENRVSGETCGTVAQGVLLAECELSVI